MKEGCGGLEGRISDIRRIILPRVCEGRDYRVPYCSKSHIPIGRTAARNTRKLGVTGGLFQNVNC